MTFTGLTTSALLALRQRLQRRLYRITLELMSRSRDHMLIHELRAERERRELIPH